MDSLYEHISKGEVIKAIAITKSLLFHHKLGIVQPLIVRGTLLASLDVLARQVAELDEQELGMLFATDRLSNSED